MARGMVSSPQGRGIIFGTDIHTGEVVRRTVAEITHMLVMGTPGFGKSVFLHQLISQLVGRPDVERLFLVDLKGGVEFLAYEDRGASVRVVWQFEDVVAIVDELLELMNRRLRQMRELRQRNWTGPRLFFIVDEFAQIQLWPAVNKTEKERHARLIANLNKLSMLGRAVGVVLVAAIQKATTDVMDSSFRTNLQGQVCFRVANRLMAASMFGSTEELPRNPGLDPVSLPKGRCIFFDPAAGEIRYLQVHVAPEAVG